MVHLKAIGNLLLTKFKRKTIAFENITHIFFDLDNTLWDAITNKNQALRKVYDEFLSDSSISFDQFSSKFDESNHDFQKRVIDGKLSNTHTRFQLLSQSMPQLASLDVSKIESSYVKALATQKNLIPHAREILEYLYSKYNLNLIVNGTQASAVKKLTSTNLTGYFNRIYSALDLGHPKPSQIAYEIATEELKIEPKNALMIGDNYHKDLSGAEKIKMNILLLNRWKGPAKCQKINSLEELKSIL